MNNVNLPENKFAILFLHTTGNNFSEQKQHEMKEWIIQNKYRSTSLVLKIVY